ncbi:FAD-linked oxidoreductase [Lachnellula occidentalis]|uniref:FAD-linked oxidoreductase n=1 Tax=Lachnellula occidentalis TaxID=215460 RepID=A0A8H8UAS8_9HELO|nr:FAD-linked oxidoreductase [Lachnellula occidentalis]
MTRFSSFAAFGLLLVQSLVTASPQPCLNGLCSYTRLNITSQQVSRELGPQLSHGSSIYGPDDPRFANATARYQAYQSPTIKMVVQPASEADIPKIVKYSNANSIAFLTVNRAHGLTATLGKFSGMQIDMGLLRDITIQKGGKTGIFQGGTYDGQVIDYLYDHGYVTTTGSCACVGMLGPGLGGGHGRYQGFYGMISDNIVKLNVVLHDGQAITVSEQSNPDLLWAMKGAGHNFGIVTSFELKIYPRIVDTWYFKNYVWKQDKLETMFSELNKLRARANGTRELAVNYGTYGVNSTISTTEAVIWWSFTYAGPQHEAQQYFDAFDKIPAEYVEDGNIPYKGIPDATGSGVDQPLCAKGFEHVHSTTYLDTWNVTSQRDVFNLFQSKITEQPLVAGSIIMLEDYSTIGVKAVDSKTSAFPWRNRNLLTVTAVNFPPNSSLDAFATEWATQTLDLFNQGSGGLAPSTYVNYAAGNEPIEQMYGGSLQKLRSLKARYDPLGKFNYYNPITPAKHGN